MGAAVGRGAQSSIRFASGTQEVGTHALRGVHVSRLLGTDGDVDALPPQVVDGGAFEVGGVDLKTEVEEGR